MLKLYSLFFRLSTITTDFVHKTQILRVFLFILIEGGKLRIPAALTQNRALRERLYYGIKVIFFVPFVFSKSISGAFGSNSSIKPLLRLSISL